MHVLYVSQDDSHHLSFPIVEVGPKGENALQIDFSNVGVSMSSPQSLSRALFEACGSTVLGLRTEINDDFYQDRRLDLHTVRAHYNLNSLTFLCAACQYSHG